MTLIWFGGGLCRHFTFYSGRIFSRKKRVSITCQLSVTFQFSLTCQLSVICQISVRINMSLKKFESRNTKELTRWPYAKQKLQCSIYGDLENFCFLSSKEFRQDCHECARSKAESYHLDMVQCWSQRTLERKHHGASLVDKSKVQGG